MKTILSLFIILTGMVQLYAQTANNIPAHKDSVKVMPKENISDAVRDSIKEAKLQAIMTYPFIKSSASSGVLPVPDVEEKQDPQLQYKLIFGVSLVDKDKMQKLNDALAEVARSLNLHVAAGIPQTHISAVVIVFKQGLNILLKDEVYKEKFNSANPNIALIKELQNAGVKFISCGQSMMRTGIQKESMIAGVKTSLAARTAFSEYEIMGYVPQ
jgi:intracellular sulfur oxidation DsrE/DsrF family protein